MGKSKKKSKLRADLSFPVASSSFSAAQAADPTSVVAVAKKGFLRRILPFLLTANLAVGAYVLARTWNKQSPEKEKEAEEEATPSIPVVNAESSASEKTVSNLSFPSHALQENFAREAETEAIRFFREEEN